LYDLDIYTPALTETTTQTTWSTDGKTMTNAKATWGVDSVIGSWTVSPYIEIWITSGTNVKTGDNNVRATVVSPTEITFNKSIKLDPGGATPSNVVYTLVEGTHVDFLQFFGNGAQNFEDVIIRNNLFYNSGIHQLAWISPATARIVNLTVENNIWRNTYDSGQDEVSARLGLYSSDNVIFRNNIVIGNLDFGSADTNVEFAGNIVSYFSPSTSEFTETDYNIINRGWYTASAHDTFIHPNSYSWDDWEDATFTGMFTDYANGDLRHASANSLGVGHSDPANSPSTDIRGKSRDSQPDAGCYEYIANGSIINESQSMVE
jgi:hypothetical protein